MIVDDYSIDDLLRPLPFKRENYTAHLYAPYSIKLHRRVYLYGHDSYPVWIMIESDPNIFSYNESVLKLPIVLKGLKAVNKSPLFVSINHQKEISFHTISKDKLNNPDESSLENAWIYFCKEHGYIHQLWSHEYLNSNKIKIENLSKLLRYTSMAGGFNNFAFDKKILSFIETFRKTVLFKVIREFPLSDPEEVKTSLGRLIISKKIFSDLDIYPFSMITEVSAYHEFDSK